jgi:peptidoglycan/LPS O-acetylase OafA/YrhL
MIVSPILAAVAVNYSDNFPLWVKKIMSIRIARWFGTCSFSIYLWRTPLYSLVKDRGFSKPMALVIGIIIGAGSYYLFENPVRIYLNNKWLKHSENKKCCNGLGV